MHGVKFVLLILTPVSIVSAVRIPRNPCPEVFSYYKSANGEIYGEAVIPYDNAGFMKFSINVSLAGILSNPKIKVEMKNSVTNLLSASTVTYQIYFPSQVIIPKITKIEYNERVYCTGPAEPLIPGTEGRMNLWASHIFTYTKPKQDEVSHEGEKDSSEVPVKPPERETSTIIRSSISFSPITTPKSTLIGVSTSKESNNEQCGISSSISGVIQFRLLNAEDSMDGQFPWVAAVFAYQSKTSGYRYKCTANVISKLHVITAARCIQYYKIQTVPTRDLLIVMGTYDLVRWLTNGAIIREVRKVQVHPEFMARTKNGHADIAVMTFSKPVTFTNNLRPVCLWDSTPDLHPYINKTGATTGWSKDKDGSNGRVIQFVEFPIVSHFECVKSDSSIYQFISNKTFCAGDKSGKGPCVVDSGAGFVLPSQGVYHLRGIASLSLGKDGECDLNSKYVIFCDVAQYVDWIKSCMNDI